VNYKKDKQKAYKPNVSYLTRVGGVNLITSRSNVRKGRGKERD